MWGLDRTGLGLGQGGEGLAGVWVWRGGHQGGARRGERASELCVCSRTECGLGPRARPRPSPTPACALGPGERARWDRREPGGTDGRDGLVFPRLCLQSEL